MAEPRLARSLVTLRSQVNAAWPARDKSTDGWIGDQAHAARVSDHNPNAAGVVTAFDIDRDIAAGFNARDLAELLVASRDNRIKYIISNRQIVSSKVSPWAWRPYDGENAHLEHVHVSVDADPALYDDPRPWSFRAPVVVAAPAPPAPRPPIPPPPKQEPVAMIDFVKFMPIVFRILALLPKIQEAMKAGAPILSLLQKYAPDMIDLVGGVGAVLFPSLPPAAQVEVGALTAFDPGQVSWIQTSMNRLNIANPPLVVDGHYGALTKAAIEAFQTSKGLVVDGWGGKVTQTAIQDELNKLPPPVSV